MNPQLTAVIIIGMILLTFLICHFKTSNKTIKKRINLKDNLKIDSKAIESWDHCCLIIYTDNSMKIEYYDEDDE